MRKKLLILTIVAMLILSAAPGMVRAFGENAINGSFDSGSFLIPSNEAEIPASFPMGMKEFPTSFGNSPVEVSFYALPPGCSVKEIKVYGVAKRVLKGSEFYKKNYSLAFGEAGTFLHKTESPFLYWEQGKMRKWSFVKLYYVPVVYAHGELSICEHLKFEIVYSQTASVSRTELSDKAFDDVAEELFVNYNSIRKFYTPLIYVPTGDKIYDYLIIIPNDNYESAISNFVSFKETKEHFKVKIVTLNEIKSLYDQGSTSDQVRTFIKSQYLNWRLKYVLLVGSPHSIPMFYMYPKPNEKRDENGSSRPIGRTPTDFFYAELDSKLDCDGDRLPGEFGEDTKCMKDLYPDVFVGRIPFDKFSSIQSVLSNNIVYETSKESFRKSALLVGAMLYYGEEKTSRQDGALALNFAWENYLKPAGFTTFSMYEEEGTHHSLFKGNVPISESNFVDALRTQKYGLVLLNAHGSPQYIARKYWVDSDKNGTVNQGEIKWETLISTSDINKYVLPPAVYYSASCETAWPEKDNIGKEILLHGGAAYIGSSRIEYGGGTIDPILEDFVKNYTLNNLSLGASLDLSLFNEPHSSIYDFVNLYDFNLYGDPSLRVNPFECSGFEMRLDPRRVDVETGHSARFKALVTLSEKEDVKLSFDTDLAGVKVAFDKAEIDKSGEVAATVKVSPDVDPGEYTVVISGTNGSGVTVSVPLHIHVILHQYEPYDLNEDGVINGEDLIIFARYLGTKKGDSNFSPSCDFNKDGVIDMKDLSIFSSHFGEKD